MASLLNASVLPFLSKNPKGFYKIEGFLQDRFLTIKFLTEKLYFLALI